MSTYVSWISKNGKETKIHARSFFKSKTTVCGRTIPNTVIEHGKYGDKHKACAKCIE